MIDFGFPYGHKPSCPCRECKAARFRMIMRDEGDDHSHISGLAIPFLTLGFILLVSLISALVSYCTS